MAYSAPSTKNAGDALAATDINVLVNNDLFFAESAAEDVMSSQGTTSTSYVDLATAGPSLAVVTGTSALVLVGAYIVHNTSAGVGYMSFAVSGASTVGASNDNAFIYQAFAVNAQHQGCALVLLTGLVAGSNTFTAKYATSSGTATFARRRIAVIPLT